MKLNINIKMIAICTLMPILLPNTFIAMESFEKRFPQQAPEQLSPERIKKIAKYQKVNDRYLVISGSSIPLWATISNKGSTDPEEFFLEKPERKNSIPDYNKQRPLSVENLYKQSMYKDRILFTREEPLFIPLDQIRYPLIINIWDAMNKDSGAVPQGKFEIKEDNVKSRTPDKWAKIISNSWDFNTGKPVKLQLVNADLAEDVERPGFNPKKLNLPRYWPFALFTKIKRPKGWPKKAAIEKEKTFEKSDLNKSLLTASQGNDTTEVLNLLKAGADVNARDENGQTPLHLAVLADNFPVVKLLLSKGANINAKDKNEKNPFDLARNSSDEVINLLEKTRVEQEGPAELDDAIDKHYLNIKDFESILKSGVNVNNKQFGDTPLSKVISHRRGPEKVQLLLQYGANPNSKDSQGKTPLRKAIEWAAPSNKQESTQRKLVKIKLLLKYGANMHAPDDQGKTPLEYAREQGLKDVLDILEPKIR